MYAEPVINVYPPAGTPAWVNGLFIVAAALLGGGLALLSTGLSDKRKRGFDESTRTADQEASARKEIELYRGPLLDATFHLGHRLNNIRHDSFLLYLSANNRRDKALHTTMYRFAEFFARVQIRQVNVNRLRLERDEKIKEISDLIFDIGQILSTDSHDRLQPGKFATSQFMLWYEEQRGIGDCMVRYRGDTPYCIGFGAFDQRFERDFAPLFGIFASEIAVSSGIQPDKSARLKLLQGACAKLVRALDTDHAYTIGKGGPEKDPKWILKADAEGTV